MSYTENWKQLCELLEHLAMPEDGDEIFLFGGGLRGAFAASRLKNELQLQAICDNDTKKWGTTIEDLPCISPQELLQYKRPYVLIDTAPYYKSIHQQLEEMGIRHCSLDGYVVRRHFEEIETVFQSLDDQSKETYSGLLFCRAAGDLTGAKQYCCVPQYFALPEFRFLEHDKGVYLDCGAYVGDTVENMIKNSFGLFSKIYAFEPGKRAFEALRKRVSFLCDIWAVDPEQIICEQKGVGAKEDVLFFRSDSAGLSGMSLTHETGESSVEVIGLDEYLAQKQEDHISFIKADIEGAELDMLRGAAKTIQHSKPKLAICIYHDITDFFRIPLYLKELVPEYQFAVRHHTNSDEETVLYCWVP